MIELDVQLSRDEELVVIHDFELERTTSGRGAVRDHNLATLKSLDAGSWYSSLFAGEPLLSLGEVIGIVAGRARLNVELKGPPDDWDLLCQQLVRLLRAKDLLDSTIISCFDPGALVAVRRRAPEARLGLLWQGTDAEPVWAWTRELSLISFHPHWMLVTEDLVRQTHQRDLQLVTWTVNEIATMRKLLEHGVDGIISDYPDRFSEAGSRTDCLEPRRQKH